MLGGTYTKLCEDGVEGPQYQIVHKYIMNPKSLTIGELYGEVNLQTLEWHDGILPLSLRTAVQVTVITGVTKVLSEWARTNSSNEIGARKRISTLFLFFKYFIQKE